MLKTRRRHAFGLNVIVSISFVLATGPLRSQETTETDTDSVYQVALSSGLYGEAEVAAKELIERAFDGGRRDELSMAELLGKLALAQRLNKNFESALQNYELTVGIIESSTDMLEFALTEPLLGIGITYIESERPGLALEHLDRALHVYHVNKGPHTLQQTEILETLASAYKKMGELRQAANIAERLYILYSRNFPDNSMELVPALLYKGHSLGEVGDRREQRNAYIEAANIVEHNQGKSSENLISPFISLGDSHVSEYFDAYLSALAEEELPDIRLLNKAQSYFESALELAHSKPDVAWQLHTDALLALGDFYTITEEQSRARVLYNDAWQLLTADEARFERRRTELETVIPLQQPAPDLTVALPDDADHDLLGPMYDTGHIVTQFTVTRRGRLTDIGLVEISPERNAAIEAEVKRNLSQFIYRPRFENGFVVDTSNQVIRYVFPYPKSTARPD